MRRIGLAILAASLILAPLVGEAQSARKIYRIGVLEVVPFASNATNPGR